MKQSLQEGKINQKQIDDACRRILEAKNKLGVFTDPFLYCDANRAAKEVTSPEKKAGERITKISLPGGRNQSASDDSRP